MDIENITIEAIRGNIADQPDITAIVNAANAQLRTGGGVAGAIHQAAGPDLEEETGQWAPLRPGEAVITGAHHLPNQYIIHCLGPVYGVDRPSDLLLGDCYRNAIRRSEEYKITSIAFPAISTGAFGYPFGEATDIALKAIRDQCQETRYLRLIRFVLYSEEDLKIYTEKLKVVT